MLDSYDIDYVNKIIKKMTKVANFVKVNRHRLNARLLVKPYKYLINLLTSADTYNSTVKSIVHKSYWRLLDLDTSTLWGHKEVVHSFFFDIPCTPHHFLKIVHFMIKKTKYGLKVAQRDNANQTDKQYRQAMKRHHTSWHQMMNDND